MSVSVDQPGRGGRKSVSASLQLVPYIDLLTCMIAFLLITAVWTQMARLEVQQRGQGQEGGGDPQQLTLAVLVHEAGFSVLVDHDQHPVPLKDGALDYPALATELRHLKQAHPDTSDIEVLSEDAIKFDTLVRTMDVAMGAGFPSISLQDAAGGARSP